MNIQINHQENGSRVFMNYLPRIVHFTSGVNVREDECIMIIVLRHINTEGKIPENQE